MPNIVVQVLNRFADGMSFYGLETVCDRAKRTKTMEDLLEKYTERSVVQEEREACRRLAHTEGVYRVVAADIRAQLLQLGVAASANTAWAVVFWFVAGAFGGSNGLERVKAAIGPAAYRASEQVANDEYHRLSNHLRELKIDDPEQELGKMCAFEPLRTMPFLSFRPADRQSGLATVCLNPDMHPGAVAALLANGGKPNQIFDKNVEWDAPGVPPARGADPPRPVGPAADGRPEEPPPREKDEGAHNRQPPKRRREDGPNDRKEKLRKINNAETTHEQELVDLADDDDDDMPEVRPVASKGQDVAGAAPARHPKTSTATSPRPAQRGLSSGTGSGSAPSRLPPAAAAAAGPTGGGGISKPRAPKEKPDVEMMGAQPPSSSSASSSSSAAAAAAGRTDGGGTGKPRAPKEKKPSGDDATRNAKRMVSLVAVCLSKELPKWLVTISAKGGGMDEFWATYEAKKGSLTNQQVGNFGPLHGAVLRLFSNVRGRVAHVPKQGDNDRFAVWPEIPEQAVLTAASLLAATVRTAVAMRYTVDLCYKYCRGPRATETEKIEARCYDLANRVAAECAEMLGKTEATQAAVLATDFHEFVAAMGAIVAVYLSGRDDRLTPENVNSCDTSIAQAVRMVISVRGAGGEKVGSGFVDPQDTAQPAAAPSVDAGSEVDVDTVVAYFSDVVYDLSGSITANVAVDKKSAVKQWYRYREADKVTTGTRAPEIFPSDGGEAVCNPEDYATAAGGVYPRSITHGLVRRPQSLPQEKAYPRSRNVDAVSLTNGTRYDSAENATWFTITGAFNEPDTGELLRTLIDHETAKVMVQTTLFSETFVRQKRNYTSVSCDSNASTTYQRSEDVVDRVKFLVACSRTAVQLVRGAAYFDENWYDAMYAVTKKPPPRPAAAGAEAAEETARTNAADNVAMDDAVLGAFKVAHDLAFKQAKPLDAKQLAANQRAVNLWSFLMGERPTPQGPSQPRLQVPALRQVLEAAVAQRAFVDAIGPRLVAGLEGDAASAWVAVTKVQGDAAAAAPEAEQPKAVAQLLSLLAVRRILLWNKKHLMYQQLWAVTEAATKNHVNTSHLPVQNMLACIQDWKDNAPKLEETLQAHSLQPAKVPSIFRGLEIYAALKDNTPDENEASIKLAEEWKPQQRATGAAGAQVGAAGMQPDDHEGDL